MAPNGNNSQSYLVLMLNFHLLSLLMTVFTFWIHYFSKTGNYHALIWILLNLWFSKLYFGVKVTCCMLWYILALWCYGMYSLWQDKFWHLLEKYSFSTNFLQKGSDIRILELYNLLYFAEIYPEEYSKGLAKILIIFSWHS